VAADPFVNSALLGIRGGLVVAVADDPAMHSSQNEQDTRVLADFARVLCLEPADPQETYDFVREAFDLSERYRAPVVLRLVTRVCHGRALVDPGVTREPNRLAPATDGQDWILLPGNARRLWKDLVDKQSGLKRFVERWPRNVLRLGDGAVACPAGAPDVEPERDGWPANATGRLPIGVITAGTARNPYLESAADLDFAPPHLHLAAYPVPAQKVHDLAALVERVLVLEEGYPFIERQLKGLLLPQWEVMGKESGALPPTGELTPEAVREALGLPPRPYLETEGPRVSEPSPRFCEGCPHRDSYDALGEAIAGMDRCLVTGDVGCDSLGALPPSEALQSCVCMGASIAMAKGAADAGQRPVLAVIGDSTLIHSGLTPLLDAIAHDTDMTVLVLENETAASTGQQPSLLTSDRLVPVLEGLGVDPRHLRVLDIDSRRVPELAEILRDEMEHHGLSVVVAIRECVESVRRKAKEAGQRSANRIGPKP
jgi:indolepyruvate ferredoxin oxidoreductase alpha subunit